MVSVICKNMYGKYICIIAKRVPSTQTVPQNEDVLWRNFKIRQKIVNSLRKESMHLDTRTMKYTFYGVAPVLNIDTLYFVK